MDAGPAFEPSSDVGKVRLDLHRPPAIAQRDQPCSIRTRSDRARETPQPRLVRARGMASTLGAALQLRTARDVEQAIGFASAVGVPAECSRQRQLSSRASWGVSVAGAVACTLHLGVGFEPCGRTRGANGSEVLDVRLDGLGLLRDGALVARQRVGGKEGLDLRGHLRGREARARAHDHGIEDGGRRLLRHCLVLFEVLLEVAPRECLPCRRAPVHRQLDVEEVLQLDGPRG
mmetsp:Transcript_53401/g.114061  ORF Transcript_53401/g.114061 Transcript_53401/m.114061 type:complete len:232 (+) Transcript_53401:252-947(+)